MVDDSGQTEALKVSLTIIDCDVSFDQGCKTSDWKAFQVYFLQTTVTMKNVWYTCM